VAAEALFGEAAIAKRAEQEGAPRAAVAPKSGDGRSPQVR
jgi:hypothetical protein